MRHTATGIVGVEGEDSFVVAVVVCGGMTATHAEAIAANLQRELGGGGRVVVAKDTVQAARQEAASA